jgi:DNA-binding LytR/AlgR family response regulator
LNKKVDLLIVEDDVLIAEYLKDVLKGNGYNQINMAHDYDEAIEAISMYNPDIIFMDINLSSSHTGVDVVKHFNNGDSVIFLTGQSDFTSMDKALTTRPVSYLTKPFKEMDVLAALNLALNKKSTGSFSFKDGSSVIQLKYDNILYFHADGNYVDIYTANAKHTMRQALSKVIATVPAHLGFVQTHRSYFVNTAKITKRSSTAVLIEDIKIPLSRTFVNAFE